MKKMPLYEHQITSEIIRYLNDESYHYAALIDGEWGCGKTYYAKNELSQAIAKNEENGKRRNLRYISIYGCQNAGEIMDRLYSKIIGSLVMDDVSIADRDKTNNKKSNTKTIFQRIMSTVKDVSKVNDVYKLAGNILLDVQNNIYLIDDVERCTCSANEIFGCFNPMVEHDGAKVIFIANEHEIEKGFYNESEPLQYLVALHPSIRVPNSEIDFGFIPKRTNVDEMESIDITEMKRRRDMVFEAGFRRQTYEQIREKLIGVTVVFQPDLSKVMLTIIDRVRDEHIRNVMKEQMPSYIDEMERRNHRNIRTFQFFVSKSAYLIEILGQLELGEHYKKVSDDVMLSAFYECLDFKVGKSPAADMRTLFHRPSQFRAVHDYVYYSALKKESFRAEIENHICEIDEKPRPDDPLYQLENEYHIRDELWVNQRVKDILKRLENDEYSHERMYPKILRIFNVLENEDIEHSIFQTANAIMRKNVAKGAGDEYFEREIVLYDSEELKETREALKKLNQIASERKTDSWQQHIIHMVTDKQNRDQWGIKLYEYWRKETRAGNYKKGLHPIGILPVDEWIARIEKSDTENINGFRKFVQQAYSIESSNGLHEDALQQIKELGRKTGALSADDKVKQMQLRWLSRYLDAIQ